MSIRCVRVVLTAALVAVALPGCWRTNCDESEIEGATGGNQTLEVCPPVDIVFIMDTSGSMDDEAEALCASISSVESDLRALGLKDIRVTLLGIVNTPLIFEDGAADSPPGPEFGCLTNTVYRVAGGDGTNHPVVPGSPPGPETLGNGNFVDPTVLDPGNNESEEFWAPATALISEFFEWLPDPATGPPTIRLIVPISDESPQSGDTECFPVDDPAVQNAAQVALLNGVLVSPILGTADGERDPCIRQLMEMLADQTGGTFRDSNEAGFELARSIFDLVLSACEQVQVSP